MTAVSLSTNRGSGTFTGMGQGNGSQYITVGTQAPSSTFDMEFRWNQTANSTGTNLTRKDLILTLRSFIRAIEKGGATVDYTTGVIGPP